ncbi:TD and POZ domain-containing protein 3-like isoform X2 [Microplitis mediator]|uniref:TD and POZ domain-containing protein 3-like isoform X2 n=1 Tax=Microplitis mediator TaxID=375433 RepID=UPI002555912F|nr:TD and POZ domain-containing protein 3-like isoform X2 [Microplitis mediator]
MPLKKIKQNVDITYEPWVLENMTEIFSKVDLEYRSEKRVEETHKFFSKFRGHEIEWYVTLKFCKNELVGGFKIYFDAVNKFEPKNHVTCNVYLIDADKNTFFIGRKNRKFDTTYMYFPYVTYNTFSYCNKLPNTIDKLLPNDAMTLRIELITYLDDDPIFPIEFMIHPCEPVSDFSDEFIKLYKCQEEPGDVIIQVQEVGFRVHKTVLEKRCPKIYDMVALHEKTSDNNKNQLAFTDIDPDIFERVLEFIYTEKVQDLDDHAEYLLKAASKFGLERLKQLCEFSLATHYLTYENSNEVKELAISCDASQLIKNIFILQDLVFDPTQIDFSCTPSGTMILKKLNGEKIILKNATKNGIPEGIKIVAE